MSLSRWLKLMASSTDMAVLCRAWAGVTTSEVASNSSTLGWSPAPQVSASQGSTVTLTDSLCLPPPRMIPRNGETSPKSRPHATATCSTPTQILLVGSSSIQPNGGLYTATQACDAPPPSSAVSGAAAGAGAVRI